MITKRTRHIAAFFLVFGALLALATYFGFSAYDLRYSEVAGRTWSRNEAVVFTSLSRRHWIILRLGMLERRARSRVLVVGGHELQYFDQSAIGDDLPDGDFFNGWIGNLSVRESRDYLAHLEKIGKLPTELIMVSIPSPHFDSGRHVSDYEADLPFDVVTAGLFEHETPSAIFEIAGIYLSTELERRFNYSYFLVGLFRPERFIRLIDYRRCPELLAQATSTAPTGRIESLARRFLPNTIKVAFGLNDDSVYCSGEVLAQALRSDGSIMSRVLDLVPPQEAKLLPQPKYEEQELKWNGVQPIVTAISQIRDLARRNDLKVAFFIQPVYEKTQTSDAHQIMSRVLQEAAGNDIIDHRAMKLRQDDYVDFRHPNDRYYRLLTEELRTRGLLSR